MANDPRRFLRYLEAERNASLLYRALADTVDGDRREALLELAADRGRARGALGRQAHRVRGARSHPRRPRSTRPTPPSWRAPAGPASPTCCGTSRRPRAPTRACTTTSPRHRTRCRRTSASTSRCSSRCARRWRLGRRGRPGGRTGIASSRRRPGEPWHRGDKSGSTRAAVFGVSDGLVSNTALVMGFAGAVDEQQHGPVRRSRRPARRRLQHGGRRVRQRREPARPLPARDRHGGLRAARQAGGGAEGARADLPGEGHRPRDGGLPGGPDHVRSRRRPSTPWPARSSASTPTSSAPPSRWRSRASSPSRSARPSS